MRRKTISAVDLMCGAGGTSTGAAVAAERLDFALDLIVLNHWDIAIATHRKNHPTAKHYCQDIATARPIEIVPSGRLDLLMASPTCTHHSRARGGKPTSDQQRTDPWHIVTWLTELRVRKIFIENVPEFAKWGPVDPRTGKPIKAREGEYFRAWIGVLQSLGFAVEWRIDRNSADWGDATTRTRFILLGRSDGRKVRWPAALHAKRGGVGLARWRPAREIIDWSIRGRSIFNRKKGLAPKTLDRILAGALRFFWPEVLVAMIAAELEKQIEITLARCRLDVDGAQSEKRRRSAAASIAWCERRRAILRLATAAPGGDGAEPMLVTLRRNADGSSVDGPLPAATAGGMHVALAEPIILPQFTDGAVRSVDDPVPPIMTVARVGLAEPMLINMKGRSDAADIDLPAPTMTAHAGHLAVVEPFICGNRTNNVPKSSDEPIGTCTTTTGGGYFMVEPVFEPFVLSQASGGAPRSVGAPLPTFVAGASGPGTALISPYYGGGSGLTCSTVEQPLPSPTTKSRFGFIVPVTHADGSNRAHDIETDVVPTITCANRGELALITAAFGEREGQAPHVHSIEEPVPAICAEGSIRLAVADVQGYDVLFRMLDPERELARAMSLSDGDRVYRFAGNKTEITRQVGNAVSVRLATAHIAALLDDRPARRRRMVFAEAAE